MSTIASKFAAYSKLANNTISNNVVAIGNISSGIANPVCSYTYANKSSVYSALISAATSLNSYPVYLSQSISYMSPPVMYATNCDNAYDPKLLAPICNVMISDVSTASKIIAFNSSTTTPSISGKITVS